MFIYSHEIVVSSVNDERVKKFLTEGWVMDKVSNNEEGLFFITFKKEVKE